MKRVAVTIFLDVPDLVEDPVEYFGGQEEISGIVGVRQAYFPPGDYVDPLLTLEVAPEPVKVDYLKRDYLMTLHERLVAYKERKILGV